MTRGQMRDAAAVLIAGLSLVLALQALIEARPELTGITLRVEGSVIVVDSLDPGSRGGGNPEIQPGMIVHEIDNTPIDDIPVYTLDRYLEGYFVELGLANPDGGTTQWYFPAEAGPGPMFAFLVGVALLFGIASWVRRGHAGEALRPLAFPLATASATSLILLPAWSILSWPTVIIGIVLSTVALLLLADGFVERVSATTRRRVAAAAAVAMGVAYVATAVVEVIPRSRWITSPGIDWLPALTVPLAAAITLVPAILLVSGRGRSLDRAPILLAALTPWVIATTYAFTYLGYGLNLPLIWLLVVVFVLQTNARAETMRAQRDRVVAATEVERARLAADLHDEALQEMTVLVRRLDDAGDAGAAELARSIADRLREVCGDLRLPVLDELGAGAALEWLVERVGETSGGQVRLERNDGARPPADVELAVFRVAQEALSNAVTHGAPPIVVRYAATSDRASLSVTDQGVGIAPDAAAQAARSGHYGLLNMRQRAEQIGARIDVRRSPDGGTSIGLSWSAG
jgi:signal transduction histidine kinase